MAGDRYFRAPRPSFSGPPIPLWPPHNARGFGGRMLTGIQQQRVLGHEFRVLLWRKRRDLIALA
jgi:hypothetical protein